MKTSRVLLMGVVVAVALSSCAIGGVNRGGIAQGGKIEIPVNIIDTGQPPPPPPPMGTICCAGFVSCMPGGIVPIGTPCWCGTWYGPVNGQVCR